MPPTSIDGTDITGATIDGTDVTEITVDGDTVFTAVPPVPFPTDLVAHYDAGSLGLSNNATVTSFDDISGNGHDLTPGTAPEYKTNEINGKAVVEFDLDDELVVSFSDVSVPWSIFMVFEVVSFDSNEVPYFHDGDSADTAGFGVAGDRSSDMGVSSDAFRMTNDGELGGGTVTTATPIMSSNVWNNSGGIMRVDGSDLDSGNLGTLNLDGFRLGDSGLQQDKTRSNIQVAEVLIYDGDKSSSFGTVENYLNAKYDVF
jgi:hypothetical protein